MLLTSHYMADVEALCKRVIVIHHGRILFDGELGGLADEFAAYKTIGVVAARTAPADLDALRRGHRTATATASRCACRRPRRRGVAARLLADQQVLDLTIEDPPIEDVIELVFAGGAP